MGHVTLMDPTEKTKKFFEIKPENGSFLKRKGKSRLKWLEGIKNNFRGLRGRGQIGEKTQHLLPWRPRLLEDRSAKK
jgi:hypothetical protein